MKHLIRRALLLLLALALTMTFVPAALAAPADIYVSAHGSDTDGYGSADAPYATLTKAVAMAEDGATIYVATDLEVTTLARLVSKDLTVTSAGKEPVTITRGENFAQIQDNARSTYNPALFEVTVAGGKDASLTLENIILDDAGRHEGTKFSQAVSGEDREDNTVFVQDAMVAAYGTDTYQADIILGDGAVLRNFGGMSAVRITANSTITMKDGSVIEDTTVKKRTKADPEDKDETGAAGAVWIQGPKFTMEKGSVIQNIYGRAVYADGGAAEISGEIRNITGDKTNIWQGMSGVMVHGRGGAEITLGSTALLTNPDVEAKLDSAVYTCGGSITMEKGSKICDLAGTGIYAYGSASPITVYMDGEIYGIRNGGNAINLNNSTDLLCTIGENGYIHDNTVWYGSIYMQGSGIHLDHYGRIEDNYSTDKSGGISMANNFSGHSVTMYPGATVKNNVSKNDGAGVLVSCGTFIMKGGEISGNYATGTVESGIGAGVYVRRGGAFIMEGGSITGNFSKGGGAGVYYDAENYGGRSPVVHLLGGEISGNLAGCTFTPGAAEGEFTVAGGMSNDVYVSDTAYGHVSRYITVGDGLTLGDENIALEACQVFLARPDGSVAFGNASPDILASLQGAVDSRGWSDTALASLWYAGKASAITLTFRGVTYNDDLPVYAAVLETTQEGTTMADGPSVKFYAVDKTADGLTVTFPNEHENGYGVALVQPTQDFGTLRLTAPETLGGKELEPYAIPYTVTYTMSENLKNLLSGSEELTIQVELDSNLTVDPAKVTAAGFLQVKNAAYQGGTLTLTCTLPEGWAGKTELATTFSFSAEGEHFSPGVVVSASGDLTATVGTVSVYVPGNAAVTRLELQKDYSITATAGKGGSIAPSGTVVVEEGQDQTFVITPDFGYTIDTLYVDGKAVEAARTFTFRAVDQNHTIHATFRLVTFPIFPGSPDSGVGDWLNMADHMAYLHGYPDGTFGPQKQMTRAEAAQMFYNLLLDQNIESDRFFTDVKDDAWYAPAVEALAELGVINGYADGTFRPNASITRAEFTAMAMRFARDTLDGGSIFSDVTTGDWFYAPVTSAADYGWINGYPDGTFRPNAPITRAEVAAVVNRMLEREADEAYIAAHGDDLRQFSDLSTTYWAYETIMEATNGHTYVAGASGEVWTNLR